MWHTGTAGRHPQTHIAASHRHGRRERERERQREREAKRERERARKRERQREAVQERNLLDPQPQILNLKPP